MTEKKPPNHGITIFRTDNDGEGHFGANISPPGDGSILASVAIGVAINNASSQIGICWVLRHVARGLRPAGISIGSL